MESEFCLNVGCGHHRKEHRGVQCTKCACRTGRYTEADKLHHAGATHPDTKRGGKTK